VASRRVSSTREKCNTVYGSDHHADITITAVKVDDVTVE
jgi:hypothetical protein